MEDKIYSLVGNLAERAKNPSQNGRGYGHVTYLNS